MRIDEFLSLLQIACSPEEQDKTDNKNSSAHSAVQKIFDDKDTIFIIIEILQNNQKYGNNIMFLTYNILRLLIHKINVDAYSNDILNQISSVFMNFILKFPEYASTFSQGIIIFAKKENFQSNFIIPLEQLAFEKLSKSDSQKHDYDFAISTLTNLVSFYQYRAKDENTKLAFYKRIQSTIIPIFCANLNDFYLPSNLIKIYHIYIIYSFNIFAEDTQILDLFINILQNTQQLNINDSTIIFLKKIMAFFHELFRLCKCLSDNLTKRKYISEQYFIKILQILPNFCLFLSNPNLQQNYNARYLQGQTLYFIRCKFSDFQKLEIYDACFDVFLKIFNSFCQLNNDDISDFSNNIFNYYNTAFSVEDNSQSDGRSNSVILLDLMSDNKDQKYINRAIQFFIQIQPNEGIFYLLSNIIYKVNDKQVKEALHLYISTIFGAFNNLPLYAQFTFIFLAARGIFLLSQKEITNLLQIASNYMTLAQNQLGTPISCFYITFASEVILNFILHFKSLPNELLKPFVEFYNLSFSTNAPEAINLIFNIYPNLFEKYQNRVIFESLKIIDQIFISEPEYDLPMRERDIIETNFYSLINQASKPNINFPTRQISELCDNWSSIDAFQTFIPLATLLFNQIVKSKANEYGLAIQLNMNLFSNTEFLNYNADIVKPFLTFISENYTDFMNSGIQQILLSVTMKNIVNHMDSFAYLGADCLQDSIACTTLLSRIIQAFRNTIPPEIVANIYQLVTKIKNTKNDIAFQFIYFEILASLTFVDNGQNMQAVITDWLNFCMTGVLKTDYYRQLHIIALKLISESFPDRANDILQVINGLNKNTINQDNPIMEEFERRYNFLDEYSDFKAPFQIGFTETPNKQ